MAKAKKVTGTTLEWTESYLTSLREVQDNSWQTITAITDLLKFHSTLLPSTSEKRLEQLENKVKQLEQDYLLGQMGKRK